MTGKQLRQRGMLSVAFVLLLGETGKEGRRIGTYRVTHVRCTRQNIDRSVLKAEHPEIYASVLKIVAWEQLAVEYAPDVVVTPPVPEMWKAPAARPEASDLPF